MAILSQNGTVNAENVASVLQSDYSASLCSNIAHHKTV